MLTALFGGAITAVVKMVPGLAGVIGDTMVKKANTEAARQGAEDQRGSEVVLGWLTSVNETNRLKAENQTERQVLFALLAFATPTAIIYWAALLDGIPFYIPYFMDHAHKVGSWKIGIAPDLKDTVLKIIDSFFISAPAIAGASILAKTFRRK